MLGYRAPRYLGSWMHQLACTEPGDDDAALIVQERQAVVFFCQLVGSVVRVRVTRAVRALPAKMPKNEAIANQFARLVL